MIIFDGNAQAAKKEQLLKQKVAELAVHPRIAAILFSEDAGSRLYSQLKKEAAERIGIEYQLHQFSLQDSVESVVTTLHQLNATSEITGIIIQKPTQKVWGATLGMEQGSELKKAYANWWHSLVSEIAIEKDVDGLHPDSLQSIENDTWLEQGRVLPATCQAVIEILAEYYKPELNAQMEVSDTDLFRVYPKMVDKKIIILGKSDLLGKPLYYYLHNLKYSVEMIGKKELDERIQTGQYVTDADVLVTATGRHRLITGEMVKDGVVIVDVGEPQADVEFESVKPKAAFITPVPGGVGPMTVMCLMENGVRLLSSN